MLAGCWAEGLGGLTSGVLRAPGSPQTCWCFARMIATGTSATGGLVLRCLRGALVHPAWEDEHPLCLLWL